MRVASVKRAHVQGGGIPHRDRLDVGDAEAAAERVFLVAMELQRIGSQQAHDLAHPLGRVVLEQGDAADQRRDGVAQRTRLFHLQSSRAGFGKDQADGIDAQLASQAYVAGAGEAAELDARTNRCALHAPAPAETAAGRPQRAS